MYILKNALRNVVRSKGRNLLISIIVFVIAVSACLGLSIRQAAENAKEEAQNDLSITAQISVDREKMMKEMQSNSQDGQNFDRSAFKENFGSMESLSIDEMLTYAEASAVQSFDYSLTVSMNGSDDFEAVENTESDTEENADSSNTASSNENALLSSENKSRNEGGGNMPPTENKESDKPGGFRKGTFGTQGDFTLTGYSSDASMTSFIDGTCTITKGKMFEEGTDEYTCVISDELALYNNIDLASNASIVITNPNNEEETFTLEVVGIYNNSQSTVTTGGQMGGFSSSTDPANQIYLSYNALQAIVDESEANATVETDEETGIETTTALPGQISSTYSFASVEDYEAFTEEVYDMGLSDTYTVSSPDVNAYEQSLVPLENLSKMALYFLFVVLGIGAVILIVLNIFSVRERKYEVGVLTAIGMKKSKVSLQFLIETLLITLIAIALGGIAGGISSVPVTNSLLESQVEAQQKESESNTQSFGREMNADRSGMPGGAPSNNNSTQNIKNNVKGFSASAVSYISEVDSAMDLTVLLQLLGIGIALTLIASAASIIFIMRYDPLKILANRD